MKRIKLYLIIIFVSLLLFFVLIFYGDGVFYYSKHFSPCPDGLILCDNGSCSSSCLGNSCDGEFLGDYGPDCLFNYSEEFFVASSETNLGVFEDCGSSQISGDLVVNGNFECDRDLNGRPDNWSYSSLSSDGLHNISWIVDSNGNHFLKINSNVSVYPDGHSNSPNFHQTTPIPVEPNSTYLVSFSFRSENMIPYIDSSQLLGEFWRESGLLFIFYNSSGSSLRQSRVLTPFFLNFTDFNDSSWMYSSIGRGSSSDWRSGSFVFFTSSEVFSVRPYFQMYRSIGQIYLDNLSLVKIDLNSSYPESPESLSKEGTLSFLNYDFDKDGVSENFFPIIASVPRGFTSSENYIDKFASYGFNTVRDDFSAEGVVPWVEKGFAIRKGIQNPVITSAGMEGWRNNSGSYSYVGANEIREAIDEYDSYSFENETVVLFDLFDETSCKPGFFGMGVPDRLGSYRAVRDYVNQKIPGAFLLSNICFPYTGFSGDIIYYADEVDILSETLNTPNAYPTSRNLPVITEGGINIRYLREAELLHERSKKPYLAFALGRYDWSDWNKGIGSQRIPFNLQRFQIWDQIINGATGVHFYGTGAIDLSSTVGAHHWLQITNLSRELSSLLDVLKVNEYYDYWAVSDNRVEVMLKKFDDKLYIFAVSTHYEDLENVRISLGSNIVINSVRALNERGNYFVLGENRSLDFDSSGFYDNFTQQTLFGLGVADPNAPGYATHIYEIEYSSGSPDCPSGLVLCSDEVCRESCGGGGGSGSSGNNEFISNVSEPPRFFLNLTCESDWSCLKIGECTNGIQNWNCVDLNNCAYGEPPSETACDVYPKNQNYYTEKFMLLVVAPVIIFILSVLVLLKI